jgi:hypothetical protein
LGEKSLLHYSLCKMEGGTSQVPEGRTGEGDTEGLQRKDLKVRVSSQLASKYRHASPQQKQASKQTHFVDLCCHQPSGV